jgi:NAD(P)-dependent dehydrogenase (short-subunit alcohol dehydrogenase family)
LLRQVRRLRCQSLICLPFAFFALALMAGQKPAVRALCEVMRQELAPEGLRCTLIAPGFTEQDGDLQERDGLGEVEYPWVRLSVP